MSWLPAPVANSAVARWVVLGVIALVVLGGIAGAGWAWYSAQESRAREAFAAASDVIQLAQAPDAPPEARANAIKALEAIMAAHPSSSIVPEVGYQLGNLQYAAGQYAAARGAYEVALAKGASGSLRALLALGIAYTWEAEKNYARAQTAYEAALAGRGPKDFLFDELLMDLARVQEFGGNRQAAIQTYQRLLKEQPDSRRGDDIRSRIASLQSAKP